MIVVVVLGAGLLAAVEYSKDTRTARQILYEKDYGL